MAAWKLLCLLLVLVVAVSATPWRKKREARGEVPFLGTSSLAKAFLKRRGLFSSSDGGPLGERGVSETLSRWGNNIQDQFSEWGGDVQDAWADLKEKTGTASANWRQSASNTLDQWGDSLSDVGDRIKESWENL